MNVDKFGHHIHKRMRLSDLFELSENALLKSPNGDYDLKTARLTGIKVPSEANDAVNKEYVDNTFCTIKELNRMIGKVRSQVATDVQSVIASTLKVKIPWVISQLEDKFYSKAEVDKIIKPTLP